MISVIGTIEMTEGRRNEFLAKFRELVPKVLAEQGCLEYGPWIDLSTSIQRQDPLREQVVMVVEKWESIEALESHLIAPHMIEYRKSVAELVVGIQLQILQPA